jgi:dTDP-L-rhamnose 4-epimerase
MIANAARARADAYPRREPSGLRSASVAWAECRWYNSCRHAAIEGLMRILVTGGLGFIGSFVVEELLGAGHAVRLLDNRDAQAHPPGARAAAPPGAEVIEGDVRDAVRVRMALDGVEAVVHAAAAVGVAQSLYRVEHYVDVNVRGTATLLDGLVAVRARPARLVMLTSMTAYGEGAYRRPSDGRLVRRAIRTEADIAAGGWEPRCPETGEVLEPVPTPETAAPLGTNVYALTKRYQEELARALGAVYGFPVVCLRLFNVFGPRQSLRNPYTGVLAIFLSRLLAGRAPVVYEDGGQTRDFVAARDVATAVRLALEGEGLGGEVLNIGSGTPRRIADVARELARLVGRPALEPVVTGQFRRGDVRHCTADVSRARQRLGFAPRVTWADGLAELVAWCRPAAADDRFAQADGELRRHGLLSTPPGSPPAAPVP